MSTTYLFTSHRLGFRTWNLEDLEPVYEINSDPKVMKYFPSVLNRQQTRSFIIRMQKQYQATRFCYFAVEKLENQELIGFIGLSEQSYSSPFTPCIDVGWRLKATHWNRGYATEGAKRCIDYGFQDLHLESIYAIAPLINTPSIRVMQKLNMTLIGEFTHPLLLEHEEIKQCVVYKY